MSLTAKQFIDGNSHAREADRHAGELDTRSLVATESTLAVALEVAQLREAVLTLVDDLRGRR